MVLSLFFVYMRPENLSDVVSNYLFLFSENVLNALVIQYVISEPSHITYSIRKSEIDKSLNAMGEEIGWIAEELTVIVYLSRAAKIEYKGTRVNGKMFLLRAECPY